MFVLAPAVCACGSLLNGLALYCCVFVRKSAIVAIAAVAVPEVSACARCRGRVCFSFVWILALFVVAVACLVEQAISEAVHVRLVRSCCCLVDVSAANSIFAVSFECMDEASGVVISGWDWLLDSTNLEGFMLERAGVLSCAFAKSSVIGAQFAVIWMVRIWAA